MSGHTENCPDDAMVDKMLDSHEVIMGLRWDMQEDRPRSSGQERDLDAFCLLFNAQSQPVDIVHPGHMRNSSGSVVHTGDSRTGAKEWDDERIFVFLDALPQDVAAVAFVVISAAGRVFGEYPGASCHVSDAASEQEYLRVDLPRHGVSVARCIAMLRRDTSGWKILGRTESGSAAIAAESLSLAANGKKSGEASVRGA